MNQKYIKVLLDELYEKKILIKDPAGYKISKEFAYNLVENSRMFESMCKGLMVTLIEWINLPVQDSILEYYDVLNTMIDMKEMEALLGI